MDIFIKKTPHLLFLLQKFCKFSRNEAPVGSLHPFRLGDHSLSNRLQVGIRFLRHPLPTYPSASLAGRFPPDSGDSWAYQVPLIQLNDLGLAFPPGEYWTA